MWVDQISVHLLPVPLDQLKNVQYNTRQSRNHSMLARFHVQFNAPSSQMLHVKVIDTWNTTQRDIRLLPPVVFHHNVAWYFHLTQEVIKPSAYRRGFQVCKLGHLQSIYKGTKQPLAFISGHNITSWIMNLSPILDPVQFQLARKSLHPSDILHKLVKILISNRLLERNELHLFPFIILS